MKLFRINLCVNIILYTIVYFIVSFVVWDLYNPFQWIINLPTYNGMDRFCILIGIVLWQTSQLVIIYNIIKEEKDGKS